jgi:hypothetical protein
VGLVHAVQAHRADQGPGEGGMAPTTDHQKIGALGSLDSGLGRGTGHHLGIDG